MLYCFKIIYFSHLHCHNMMMGPTVKLLKQSMKEGRECIHFLFLDSLGARSLINKTVVWKQRESGWYNFSSTDICRTDVYVGSADK